MPAKCWHAPSCQGKTCRLTGEEKTFVTSYSYKANGLVPPAPSTGCHGTGSHNCHPERSEGPLRPRERSLAALGMTGGLSLAFAIPGTSGLASAMKAAGIHRSLGYSRPGHSAGWQIPAVWHLPYG